MSHYVGVDDPNDASLLFVTWYASGLRVFDIRDPRHPREVAYYNPPVGEGASRTHDWSTTHPRYDPRTGQVWFGSKVNGFNVVELHPSLRPRKKGQPISAGWSVAATTGPAIASDSARTADDSPPPPQLCTLG